MSLIGTISEQGWDKAIVALAGVDELKRIYERCQALGIKPRVLWSHPDYDQQSPTGATFYLTEEAVDKAIRVDMSVGVNNNGMYCRAYVYEYYYDPSRCDMDIHTCEDSFEDDDYELGCAACDSEYGEDWCRTHQGYH